MLKKWNWILTLLATVNTICLLILVKYVSGLNQGMAIMAIFIFPLYFLFFSIIILIISYIKRKVWFIKEILFSTCLMLFFCSPLPFFIGMYLSQPTLNTSIAVERLDDDRSLKTEEDKLNGETKAIRYWISYGKDTTYLKDSTWVFFNEEGDTSKIQIYRNDSMIIEK